MFFILGLPRSRTAWLANFLTYDGLYCHHEGVNHCTTMDEYWRKLGDDGDSTTVGNLLKVHEIDCPKIIIDRDISHAIEFSIKNYGKSPTQFLEECKDYLDRLDGLHVKYEEIDKYLELIWSYLSNKPFDRKRAEILTQMNIQKHDIYDIEVEALCPSQQ